MSNNCCPPDKGGASETSGGFCFCKNHPPAPPAYAGVTTPLSGGQGLANER